MDGCGISRCLSKLFSHSKWDLNFASAVFSLLISLIQVEDTGPLGENTTVILFHGHKVMAFVDDKNRAGQEKLACEEGRNIACHLPKLFSHREWDLSRSNAMLFLMISLMRAADTGLRREDTLVVIATKLWQAKPP